VIHYHGVPLSGPATNLAKILPRRHAMVSFAHPGPIQAVANVCQSFSLDNGAFSAWKSGHPIKDWGPFRDWLSMWTSHPGCDWFLIPDVIDGSEEDNDRLVDLWHGEGVPVWHLHESTERLDRLVSQWPRVALGSSGAYASIGTADWWGRMAEAMVVACDEQGRPRTKLHGLRMLDPTIFSHLPLASADSTNVARNMGLDSRWSRGPYAPVSTETRAAILMERIEVHASAEYWNRESAGVNQNWSLIG